MWWFDFEACCAEAATDIWAGAEADTGNLASRKLGNEVDG
jgi:hypothetical protein